MPFWIPIAAMAGAGLAKHYLHDAPKAKRQNQLAAETARYSPWTGLNPQNVPQHDANLMGSVMQGGMSGAMMGSLGGMGAAPAAVGLGATPTAMVDPNVVANQVNPWEELLKRQSGFQRAIA